MYGEQTELPRRLTDRIEDLVARNDLAAAIIHLNDTYQIEARPPDIPGMARIARLVQGVTNLVEKATGEDRTLVVHSGDYLSPSYMTTRLGFAGKQMVDLLNCSGIDYATPGNHEFDIAPDQLRQRVNEARFPLLCANLASPPEFPELQSVALWPEDRPFLAISGLAGAQTVKKATKTAFGFQSKPYDEALKEVLDQVQTRPEIGAFVLLTHMDRDEDKDVQQLLRRHWRKAACAFVLGGHDHDISWQEPGGNSVLCKNLSNARTVTVILLTKSAVAAPRKPPSPRYRSREDTIAFGTQWETLEEQWDGGTPPPGAEPLERIVDRTVATWRDLAPPNLRPDFVEAFAAQLRATAAGMSRRLVEKEDFLQGAEYLLFVYATESAFEPFRFLGQGSGIPTLDGDHDLSRLAPEPEAQRSVNGWVDMMRSRTGDQGREILIDFSAGLPAGARLNGQDEALRAGSTDFGNFAADALESATGADLALINAGSFRLDDMVGPILTRRDLLETFLYDHPGAVVVVDLTADEVRNISAHARHKAGQGGFLQVSRGFESVGTQAASIRTALVRHMLDDDEDGYQSLLASSRHCGPEELAERMNAGSAGGLIDLISQGARTGVAYSATDRLVGTAHRDDRRLALEAFIGCVDRYRARCRSLGDRDGGLYLLELDPDRAKLSEELAEERMLVRLMVMQLAVIWGLEWVRRELYDDLLKSDLQYRRATAYHDYLDRAMMYFDFHIIHPRLHDEEGVPQLPDAASMIPQNRSPQPSAVASGTLRELARIFAERVDEYRAACRAQQVDDALWRQMLEPDPDRQPPTGDLRAARFGLRQFLMVLLVHHGWSWVETDFAAGLRALGAGDAQAAQYEEYLTATLSYFAIFPRYGLLVNEEER
jgi:2',3'-cyclic-nucleotide 2'-phosphodiesterase (5'-nucleotidase family)